MQKAMPNKTAIVFVHSQTKRCHRREYYLQCGLVDCFASQNEIECWQQKNRKKTEKTVMDKFAHNQKFLKSIV